MRKFHSSYPGILCVGLFVLWVSQAWGDSLTFVGGDSLRGKLVSIHPENGVEWQYPEVEETIQFDLGKVEQLKVDQSPEDDLVPETHAVRLLNGDSLKGEVLSINQSEIFMESESAGSVTLARNCIESMSLNDQDADTIFDEPFAMKDWKLTNNNSWREKGGAIYSKGYGTLGKKFELPDQFYTEFDIAWEASPYLNVYFCTEKNQSPGGNYYMLSINSHQIMMRRHHKGTGKKQKKRHNQWLVRHPIKPPAMSRSRVGVGMDRKTQRICILLDGKMVGEFRDPYETPPDGQCLLFNCYGNHAMRISNLKVTEWDGLTPGVSNENMEKDDRVHLINGDVISGALSEMKEGQITFKTSYADLNLDQEEILSLHFSKAKRKTLELEKDMDQLFLRGGSRLTVRVEEMNPEHWLVNAQTAGHLQLKSSHVLGIRLSLTTEESIDE